MKENNQKRMNYLEKLKASFEERYPGLGIDLDFQHSYENMLVYLEEHPKDEYGDYDFETPEALDLALINEHLFKLLRGEEIKMPQYDFKTGRRALGIKKFHLKKGDILLIDSLHGLYPKMTSSVPHEMKFKLYIEALCQIRDKNGEFVRWADLRMLRRMARDSWQRSYDPEKTVGHWHYVRRSEKRNIVPCVALLRF